MFSLFWESAWKVVVAGLVLGAGLPALFAVGVRSTVADADGPGTAVPRRVGGVTCFVVVGLLVALGLTVVVATGFGKQVSFEHVFPTIVAKS